MSAVKQVEHLSGFAKKKRLEELGVEFLKARPRADMTDPVWVARWKSCKTMLGYNRLQGPLVDSVLHDLGGL